MRMNRRKIAELHRSDEGAIAVLAAMALPVLILLVGGVLDYSMAIRQQYRLQTMTDAALLATLSHQRSQGNTSITQLKQIFLAEIQRRYEDRFKDKTLKIEEVNFSLGKDSATALVKAKTKNMFMRIVGMPYSEMNAYATVKSSTSRTEVALVLDITGSMRGRKIREMKKAVKSFLDNIYAKMKNAPPENFKVAVVPFSKYVNIGKDKRGAPWLQVYRDGWRESRIGRRKIRRYVAWEGCVGSRDYPFNITDDSYKLQPVRAVMNLRRDPRYSSDEAQGWWPNPRYGKGVQRCQQNVIIPLKSVKDYKDYIIKKVNSFNASGWTYIPAGLSWGWRVLSHGAPYTEGASDSDVNKYNVQKVIVLMTDGANTVAPYRSSYYAYHDHGSSSSSYANRITRELCDNIKAVNPATGKRNAEIITVTFDVRYKSIKRLMKNCASLGSFDASTGQLSSVFDQIAQRLVELHLSR